MSRVTWAVLCSVLASLAVGCASQEEVLDLNRRLTSLDLVRKKEPDATYVVDPPDTLLIEFIMDPGLTRSVTLRPDGNVTLPHVEDVKVAGMMPMEIRAHLEEMYAKYYREPRILVTVTGYNSKHLYVYGEVGRQGRVPYTGQQTVSSVIGAVGGVTTRAAMKRVKVIRGDLEEPEEFRVNLKTMLYEGRLEQDVSLAQNDVLYVPPTYWAMIGYKIDQVLFPFRPALSAYGMFNVITDSNNN